MVIALLYFMFQDGYFIAIFHVLNGFQLLYFVFQAAKGRFVAVAATGFERGVREFYTDLGGSLEIGVTLHQKGIYSTIGKGLQFYLNNLCFDSLQAIENNQNFYLG